MKGHWSVSALASILILGSFGLSQEAFGGIIPAEFSVTDQFFTVHIVDVSEFLLFTPDACISNHLHAVSGGFVTSTLGVEIFDPDPPVCGYGIDGDPLTGIIEPGGSASALPGDMIGSAGNQGVTTGPTG